ncbi:MAG: hypothetical protein ACXW61_12135 [Gemmatirosa sp.]
MELLSAAAALALRLLAQVTVAVSAPVEVGPRDPVLVKVEVTAPAGRDVRLVPPALAPMRVLSSMRVAAHDSTPPGGAYLRAPWQVVEFRYVLAVPEGLRGRHEFAPFVAEVAGRGVRPTTARSRPWALTVRAPVQPARVPSIVERTPRASRQGIAFHAQIGPDTVYVGQQATYQIAVFLDDDVRQRLRRNPEFVPPELRGLLAYDLPAGRASLRGRVIDGRRYDVHVFQRAVFPLAAGRLQIPPAQLTYALPLTAGFFSREESYSARSEAVRLVAIEPPTEGRPADWTGAVGDLRATARLDSSAARVGDPVVLTLRVQGVGNVKLLPRPTLRVAWATAVDGEERVELDSSALAVRGAKEFDWILTPRSAGAREVPPIRYAYFDPVARAYDVAVAPALPIQVLPGTLAEASVSGATAGGGGAPLSIRERFSGPSRTPLPSQPVFWLLIAAVPLPALIVSVIGAAPRRAARVAQPPARTLRALATSGGDAPLAVRRAFVSAVRDRLPLGPDAFAAPATLAHRLRRCGVTSEGAREAGETLRALDAASFGTDAASRPAPADLAQRAWGTFQRLDEEGCGPRASGAPAASRAARAAFPSMIAAALTAAVASSAMARQPARDTSADLTVLQRQRAEHHQADDGQGLAAAVRAFERGVRAYRAEQLDDARVAFAAAAEAAPRAADAWANLGTTAWAQGDTVTATVGWQRALRLSPLSSDVRDRLALLPTAQDGWIGGVPPHPPDALAIAGLLTWAAAGASVVLRLRRRGGRGMASVLWPAAGTAVALLAVAVHLSDLARARDLAVVRRDGPLRAEPALGADQAAPLHVSDVARVVARQHAWSRVRLDGEREGWVESDRLVPLTAP